MGPQPSITNWKNIWPHESGYPDWWPQWRSPDVFTDNDGDRATATAGTFEYYTNVDEPDEPLKGKPDNRLFAIVRNLGDTAATGVQVQFSYAPYGAVGGGGALQVFKTIATASIDLDPASKKEVEVQWDLSNLTEDNGGVWPAPLAYFNHFCVKVTLNYPPSAQHNYFNVLSSSPCAAIPMMIANTGAKEAKAEFLTRPVKEWNVGIRGLVGPEATKEKTGESALLGHVSLKPGEARFITLKISPPPGTVHERQDVQVAVRIGNESVGGFSVTVRKPERRLSRFPYQALGRTLLYPLPPSFGVPVTKEA